MRLALTVLAATIFITVVLSWPTGELFLFNYSKLELNIGVGWWVVSIGKKQPQIKYFS